MTIKFSIVTPTYNRAQSGYLEACIKSIQQQSRGDYSYEHIVVDDGSIDDTASLIKRLQQKYSHIIYLRQKNSGPAKAIQRGIQAATGTHVIILDDDDMLTKDSLEKRAKFIAANPNIDWFYGYAEAIDEYGLPTASLFQSKYDEYHLYEKMLITNQVNAGTPTVASTALNAIVWPDWLNRSQDYFLWLELLRPEQNLHCGFLAEKLVKYRYHSNSYTSNIIGDKQKDAKKILNTRIKHLHPEGLVFLAEEALRWREEAHQNHAYHLTEIKNLNSKIKELYKKIEDYEFSKVVKPAIKARNVARAQSHNVRSTIARIVAPFRKKTALQDKVVVGLDATAKSPLISVITPFYNRADTMPETVRSVLKQTFRDFEYIVVDDGSSEEASKEYLHKLKHPMIRVTRQQNQGVATARNTGIAQAKGKYIICLDSDDVLEPTFVEKAVLVLEQNPDMGFVTFDTQMFGEINEPFVYPAQLNPLDMLKDNYVITAALFRRKAWEESGGYKKDIGYEDWEFWVNITEHGYFGIHIPERLFRYRTAKNSRYIDDLKNHQLNADHIKALHPNFVKNVKKIQKAQVKNRIVRIADLLPSLEQKGRTMQEQTKPSVLIFIPWMPVGGAETLTLTFCEAVKTMYSVHFMTGIPAPNEWEYRYREITPNIVHLPNICSEDEYGEFIEYYVRTRGIDIIHIVHSGYAFSYLENLKRLGVKVVVTLFNDRVPEYVQGVTKNAKYIDVFSSDNKQTLDTIGSNVGDILPLVLIPNAVEAETAFNPENIDDRLIVEELGLSGDQTVITFLGRLSEEKNPDVFVEAASKVLQKNKNSKIVFVMIGDGPMHAQISQMVATVNDSRFRLLGYRKNVPDYLKVTDILVVPSKIEGLPLSILEAMAMRSVVIASRVGAIPDVISDGEDGYLIAPGSTQDLVSRLELCLKNESAMTKMKQKARKKILKYYSIDRLTNDYDKLYKKAQR